ncbi:hypothetical protein [Marinagarivorans cellulosilyticus]|uniref:Uncharacterized protein n=1 Tax=Marinagarivorans cellulosilyticus TaxID=2721545 RepID=A0AAN1WE08_9GAMM|nr:hypothetical protein [Marinagarivorans cellulosilyticus]BCD95863.1 hypothetical protein MARGE09_P0062 [Marinagarivorans cellulosilyticus]
MNYEDLTQEEFDVFVTGELTHRALALEDQVNAIISEYFIGNMNSKEDDFRRLILDRDGLTSQDKIEIVRAMIPIFGQSAKDSNLKKILNEVEKFKSLRNAMAHGQCRTDKADPLRLKLRMVTRSGKEKIFDITPDSHRNTIAEVDELIKRLTEARDCVCDY